MDKIKKNWQIIVIVILLLFSMSKCTQSCNRQGIINEQSVKIEKLDSLNQINISRIQFLERDTTDYLNQIRMYQKFNNSRAYSDSINQVNMLKQREQTDALVRQTQNLVKKINEGNQK